MADSAYHAQYPEHITKQNIAICHLEALNCLVTLVTLYKYQGPARLSSILCSVDVTHSPYAIFWPLLASLRLS